MTPLNQVLSRLHMHTKIIASLLAIGAACSPAHESSLQHVMPALQLHNSGKSHTQQMLCENAFASH